MDSRTTYRNQVIDELEAVRRQFMDLRILLTEPRTPSVRAGALETQTHSREVPPTVSCAPLTGLSEDASPREQIGQVEAAGAELEEISRGMNLLTEMGDTLRACLTPEEVYEVVADTAFRICPVEAGALYLPDRTHDVLEAVASWGDDTRLARAFNAEECWALRRRRIHVVRDTGTGLSCKHLGHSPPAGYLCVPLLLRHQETGILYFALSQGRESTSATVQLVTTMADQIAIVLTNLRLQDDMQHVSVRDPLTGLFTVSFMREYLGLELSRVGRSRGALGVIEIELDRFNSFRESLEPDALLSLVRQLAGLLRSSIRREDVACRSDERRFVLVLPEAGREVIRRRGEQLRRTAQSLDAGTHGAVGRVSVSAGVSIFPEHGSTAPALLQAAESALKRAGEAGGDTVVMAGE
jgi:diguanylate cyclase (GGDEF)-like protein